MEMLFAKTAPNKVVRASALFAGRRRRMQPALV
jgi:hypothetical protein